MTPMHRAAAVVAFDEAPWQEGRVIGRLPGARPGVGLSANGNFFGWLNGQLTFTSYRGKVSGVALARPQFCVCGEGE